MDDPAILATLTRIEERLTASAERMGEIALAGKETAWATRGICERLDEAIERIHSVETARLAEHEAAVVKEAEQRGRESVGAILTRRQLWAFRGMVLFSVAAGGLVFKIIEAVI